MAGVLRSAVVEEKNPMQPESLWILPTFKYAAEGELYKTSQLNQSARALPCAKRGRFAILDLLHAPKRGRDGEGRANPMLSLLPRNE